MKLYLGGKIPLIIIGNTILSNCLLCSPSQVFILDLEILIFNLQIASFGVRLAVGVPGLQEIGGVGLAGSEVRGLGLSHRAIAIGVGVRW